MVISIQFVAGCEKNRQSRFNITVLKCIVKHYHIKVSVLTDEVCNAPFPVLVNSNFDIVEFSDQLQGLVANVFNI